MKCSQHPDFDLPCGFAGCSSITVTLPATFSLTPWTAAETRELGALQETERLGDLDLKGTARLHRLRTKLAMLPEVEDDPKTLFTDESRRPQLDGSDYNDTLKAMTCSEVEAALLKGLKVLGDVALKAVVARVLP